MIGTYKIGKNITVILDSEDYERVSKHSWNFASGETTIQATINRKSVTLPRFLLDYAGPMDIDHKDLNKFNNSKENFRFATRSQNMANSGPRGKKYKGICFNKRRKKYAVRMTVEGKIISGGSYTREIDAAAEYNRLAKQYFGEFAYLNKVEVPSDAR